MLVVGGTDLGIHEGKRFTACRVPVKQIMPLLANGQRDMMKVHTTGQSQLLT
jgi:hypothetical protein